jgi:hypothetical protein
VLLDEKTFDLKNVNLLYWDTRADFDSETEIYFNDNIVPIIDFTRHKGILIGFANIQQVPYKEAWKLIGDISVKYNDPMRVALEEALVVPEIQGLVLEAEPQPENFELVKKFWVTGLTFKSRDSSKDIRLELWNL